MGNKYVIIDKTDRFGYGSSTYADAFNMTLPEYATVFEDKELAEKIALGLNLNKGYDLQVYDYEDALFDIVKETAEKVKASSDDNVIQNRMWTIIHSIEKLRARIEEKENEIRDTAIDEFAEQMKRVFDSITIAEAIIDDVANEMKKEPPCKEEHDERNI